MCREFMDAFFGAARLKYVFLPHSDDTALCLQRIRKRGRRGEENMSLDYLNTLAELHGKMRRDLGERVQEYDDFLAELERA